MPVGQNPELNASDAQPEIGKPCSASGHPGTYASQEIDGKVYIYCQINVD